MVFFTVNHPSTFQYDTLLLYLMEYNMLIEVAEVCGEANIWEALPALVRIHGTLLRELDGTAQSALCLDSCEI